MSAPEHNDNRDERLRKLLGRLPAMKAPPDFEARVARAIAEDRPRRGLAGLFGAWPAGIRTAALSGAALLLVGLISFLVFRGGPSVESVPEFDGPGAPAGAPAESAATITAPAPLVTPDQQAVPGQPPNQPAGRQTKQRMDKADAPPAAAPAPQAPPASQATKDATTPTAAARSKTKTVSPLLLMERTAIESTANFFRDSSDSSIWRARARAADSARIADSLKLFHGLDSLLVPDTLETRPDSLSPAPPKRR